MESIRICNIASMKKNWLFLVSATAFLCLNFNKTLGYFLGMPIALLVIIIFSTQFSSIWDYVKPFHIANHVVSVVTAAGICWAVQPYCYGIWSSISKIKNLEARIPFSIDIPFLISIFGAVAAIYFVYVLLVVFWKEIAQIFLEIGIHKDIKKSELYIYGFLLFVTFLLITIGFSKTEAFYGTEYYYDIIYTSDSPYLVKDNVYLNLMHSENDLRQPLFAIFAAPFLGMPYFIGRLLGVSASVQAMLLNYVQIIMLYIANYMLTKIMNLNMTKRISFMILMSCTYTNLLFVLMMEQYIVAYFWLVFCIYVICEGKKSNRIVLWGAGGTLLTSLLLLPFISHESPLKNVKAWFKDMFKYGMEFIFAMLFFCRFDVIYNLGTKIVSLSTATGKNLSLMDKVYQYIEFIRNCFVAPKAGISFIIEDHISWQLQPIDSISFLGVGILIVVIISAILNRKKSSLFAIVWVGFSIVMLLGLGWGTKENGLILYALYFGWAFLLLIFQLFEWFETKLKVRWLVPLASGICSMILLIINVPAIIQMIDFATMYFPT